MVFFNNNLFVKQVCVEQKNLKFAFSLFAEMKRYQIKPNMVRACLLQLIYALFLSLICDLCHWKIRNVDAAIS